MTFESLRDLRRYFGPGIGSVNISRDRYRSVPFESELERDWLLLSDAFDLSLRSIVPQPRVDVGQNGGLPYRFDGHLRHWIPDFVRVRKGRNGLQDPSPDLVEVKPLIELYPEYPDDERRQESERAWVKAKWEAVRTHCQARGFGFELATENEIRVQPGLANAETMRTCAGPHFPSHWEKLGRLAVLRLPRESSIRDLQRVLPNEVDAFSVALRLTWRGELLLDPAEEWTRTTKFARA
ncbi:TnsA endonuclease N-terminal domain-containing protein [Bradyrhizobium manausense]|uniref:TnsA endonuclease N-terminal domain-containing protein n=1 Tax=Bradyrhizobium manausense TaxID=989370 RepID=A0A0R3DXQ5_9BRAD|nr:TnsA endonuclease N-terminal domain-containing protein [Bradyrhizobium manausense]KRQ14675.1 hypothetical protein AOQ71_12375 [Bradyrhizobium manausense]